MEPSLQHSSRGINVIAPYKTSAYGIKKTKQKFSHGDEIRMHVWKYVHVSSLDGRTNGHRNI